MDAYTYTGFCISNGVPKVGQLLNAAWDLMNICRFKILPMSSIQLPPGATMMSAATLTASLANSGGDLKESLGKLSSSGSNSNPGTTASSAAPTSSSSVGKSNSNVGNKETADRLDMPPPPSPASSTCSDTGSVSNKRQKRMLPKEDPDSKKDEEIWSLKDVVFVEDVRSVPVGKVLKVDGQFAAVRFPSAASTNPAKEKLDDNSVDAWSDCRLLRKDELQVIKANATSRVPDCFQKIPRRIVLNVQLNENSQLLTLAIDAKGIHAVMRTGQKLHYSLFNLSTGRLDQSSVFPTDLNSFMGTSASNISLTCAAGDSNESVLILRDGNKTIYPMAKDCVEAIKDPNWLDLPPLTCIAAAPLTLPSNNANLKSQVALVILATEQQTLMPRILRCDSDGVKHLLGQLESELKSDITSILHEHTDGNRNIMHACICMCSPTSNKDSDQETLSTVPAPSPAGASLECVNVIANARQLDSSNSRVANIRELMRRSSTSSAFASGVRNDLEHHGLSLSGGATAGSIAANSADDNSMSLSYWPPEYEATSGDEDSLSGLSHSQNSNKVNQEIYVSDPTERRLKALQCIQMLCENTTLQPHLKQLLSAKDAQGQTPFMLSVSSRAYQAGIVLLEAILKISNGDAQVRDSMIFPVGSAPDQSPLHVLCCNDTCSFTWTGADHINQDIFECRTCGLTGSLCCCTECAKVCHKGHDCKLKRTSPTAYCDCWEKCKCKALIAGNQTKRFELLEKLIKDSDLVTRFNSRGESILLFLIQTVGRQSIEQRQYQRSTSRVRNSSSGTRKTPSLDTDSEMPEHDLEPPRFARKALERFLGDWNAVRSMILTGAENEQPIKPQPNQVFFEDNDNKGLYIQTQSGTTLLDKFTHSLFVRCNNDSLNALLMTLVSELQNETITGRAEEAQKVARRFVRSVARVFVIFSIEKSSNPDKQRSSTTQARLTLAYRRVFTSLMKFSIEELVEIADSLIAPVRLGVVRPTAPFQMSSNSMDAMTYADDLFSVEPLAPPPARPSSTMAQESSSRLDLDSNAAGFLARITSALRGDMDDNNDADAMVQDDDGGSGDELNDSRSTAAGSLQSQRQNNNNNGNDEAGEDNLAQDANQEPESDNEFNFQEAETESDSDDNQSTQDAQRSVQTGATAGSDTDDSGDSSQPDEDGSEDAESDEHSQEDFTLADEQLERRPTAPGNQRGNLAPHSMQWAIRSRTAAGATNLHRLTGGSNLVFIDPNALRRSTAANAAVAAAQEPPTMATTCSSLARAFGIVLRQISELVGMVSYNLSSPSASSYQTYDLSYQEAVELQMFIERRLKSTWDWILTVMDATEAQLRFGASLTDSADPAHPLHPLNVPSTSTATSNTTAAASTAATDSTSTRRDFLTYCLSLMRAHNSEHRDSLPVLDAGALRHVAYVLDAIIFYMRATNDADLDRNDSSAWDDQDDNETDDVDDELSNIVMETDSFEDTDLLRPSLGKRHGFFQRSESTLCLGCPPPDAFNTPMAEGLPLADQPHLLQPNARREDLFGMPKQPITVPSSGSTIVNSLELPPIRLGLSLQNKADNAQNNNSSTNTVVIVTPHASLGKTCVQLETVNAGTSNAAPAKETDEEYVPVQRNKRPLSPKAGPSKNEIYYKKSRHFFMETANKNYEQDELFDDESGDDEPQAMNLTQQAMDPVPGAKMEIDEASEPDEEGSDDAESDEDEESDLFLAELQKKDQAAAAAKTIIRSGGGNIGETSITPAAPVIATGEPLTSSLTADVTIEPQLEVDPNVRPPIIVTRRNVADAIESSIENVLAKNNKQSLIECMAPETPLTLLPSNFVYAEKDGEEKSPGKSVIVRVGGPSTSAVTDLQSSQSQSMETMDTQDVSANITIETTKAVSSLPQMQQELPPRGIYFRSNVTSDLLLGRWRLSLILFGRVFLEDVGMEPGSIISELGGFPVKEAKFRRHMEKLRNAQQRDLTLSKIDRARACLITQTFKELNTQYNNNNRRMQPPLAFNRVKVTFKDEPGEGSGVARSFYTLIAESLLSRENLPNLEAAQIGSSKYSVPFSTMIRHRGITNAGQAQLNAAPPLTARIGGDQAPRRLSSKQTLLRPNRDHRKLALSFDSRPFRPATASLDGSSNDHLSSHQQQLGERLYHKVYQLYPTQAPKITGMLLDLPPTQLLMLLASDETLRQKSSDAIDIITFRQRLELDNLNASANNQNNNNNGGASVATANLNSMNASPVAPAVLTAEAPAPPSMSADVSSPATPQSKKLNPIVVLEDCALDDNAPLFYTPGKPNIYSPRQGYPSFERVNAFRNVGRLVGLCLLQNELLPIFLQRHVLKYILGRQIRFHDLAFFDPIVYESLRQLVKDSQTKNGAQVLQSLELNFVIDLCPEEGGGSVELVHNGRDIIVSEQNVYDYVRRYAEYRMIKTQEKALEALRAGVFDVLPETALDTLTGEDLRLLLNGVGDINVSTLSTYTSFNDESNESPEKLQRFKRWLWQIVERMTNLERQDLIYFWTGSPALPASEEGFQPMPSVTIRPADDAHLPTANTCISRLYIPLYSNKAVLRQKLLLAITTKNFGFV